VIYSNDTGPVTFQIGGTVFATTIRADGDIGAGDPVRVIAPGNIAEPLQDVALSLLGFGGSIGAGRFDREETDTAVTIPPGDTATVLRVPADGADWVSVGTSDNPPSEYQYYVDGVQVFDQPLKSPLGLYNEPFTFPTPLGVDREIRVEVTRPQSASASADYVSKITLFR